MRKECEEVQVKIVSLGIAAAKADPATKAHLATCPLCADFVHSAADLESAEENLEEHDVSEDVFLRTISEVKKAQAAVIRNREVAEPEKRSFWRLLYHPLGTPVVAAALCGVIILAIYSQEKIAMRRDIAVEASKESAVQAPIADQEVKQKSDLPADGKQLEPRAASAPITPERPAVGASELKKAESFERAVPEHDSATAGNRFKTTVRRAPEEAAQAVMDGRFEEARTIVEAMFEIGGSAGEKDSAAAGIQQDFDRKRELLAAIEDLARPGRGTVEARSAVRDRILRSRAPVPALE